MNKNNNDISVYTDQMKELLHTPNGVRESLGFPTDGAYLGFPIDGAYYSQPNPHEVFQNITEGMLEVFKRKNADYGNSFDKSLDDDGLLVAKVRLGDKYNRFSQLIKQTQQVSDESLEDTLLDMANYAIMTVMWMRGQDKQLEINLDTDGDLSNYIPKEQYDKMVEWAESELCGAVEGGLKVGDMVIYTDSNNITSTGKITEVVALISESLDTPSLRYVIDGELYSRKELSKCADDTMDKKHESLEQCKPSIIEPYKRGNRVRIVKVDDERYIDKYIGKVGIIQKVIHGSPNEYTLMFKPGKWTHDMLELITEE